MYVCIYIYILQKHNFRDLQIMFCSLKVSWGHKKFENYFYEGLHLTLKITRCRICSNFSTYWKLFFSLVVTNTVMFICKDPYFSISLVTFIYGKITVVWFSIWWVWNDNKLCYFLSHAYDKGHIAFLNQIIKHVPAYNGSVS